MGPRARPARPPDVRGGPADPGARRAAAGTACGARARPRATRAATGATTGADDATVRRARGRRRSTDWDATAVDAQGGHVLQSRAWAEHREATGWQPRFLAVGDARALVLVRPWPVVGGGSAYVPRGPVRGRRAVDRRTGRGAGSARRWPRSRRTSRRRASTCVAADPEVAADDAGYGAALGAAGFHAIAEIQPSRHRMAMPLPADGDATAIMDGVAKATRQRIRRAERDGVAVVRWDARPDAGTLEGPMRATEPPAAALGRFYDLLRATGDRRGFGFAGADEFVTLVGPARWPPATSSTSRRARASVDGDVLGGLVLYRHGRRLSTAHSADRAERRHDHPGAMHLLRWRAIELALAERPDRDGPRRRRRRGRAPRRRSTASRRTGCTSTSGRSGRRGWRSRARRSASRGRGATAPGGRASRAGRALVGPADRTGRDRRRRASDRRACSRRRNRRSRDRRRPDRAPAGPPGSCAARGGTACRSAPPALGDIAVRGVTDDSRAVREGTLFVAVPGFHVDGHDYVGAAAAAGAAAAIVEHPVPDAALPQLVVSASRAALARAAAGGTATRRARSAVVGITGTDGKTHHLVPRRGRPRGGRALDGPRRHRRDEDRRRPRAPRRPRDDARRARAAGDARRDGPRGQRGRGARDDVARPRARSRPGRRL